MTYRTDPVAIQFVLVGVGSQPAHGRLAVLDLRRKSCHAAQSVTDGGNGVPSTFQVNASCLFLFPRRPAATVNDDDDRERTIAVGREIQVEQQSYLADLGVFPVTNCLHSRWNVPGTLLGNDRPADQPPGMSLGCSRP